MFTNIYNMLLIHIFVLLENMLTNMSTNCIASCISGIAIFWCRNVSFVTLPYKKVKLYQIKEKEWFNWKLVQNELFWWRLLVVYLVPNIAKLNVHSVLHNFTTKYRKALTLAVALVLVEYIHIYLYTKLHVVCFCTSTAHTYTPHIYIWSIYSRMVQFGPS